MIEQCEKCKHKEILYGGIVGCVFMDADCKNGEKYEPYTNNELTDNEIIKALECCTTNGASCKDCPAFVKVDRSNCKKYFRGSLDLINRLQAKVIKEQNKNSKLRNERNRLQAKLDEAEDTIQFAYKELKKAEAEIKTELDKLNAEKNDVMYHKAQIKAEAYKEFADKVHTEIHQALESNYKARAERMAKPNIDMADEFISYCEGKIATLRGIDDFVDETCKQLVGDDK